MSAPPRSVAFGRVLIWLLPLISPVFVACEGDDLVQVGPDERAKCVDPSACEDSSVVLDPAGEGQDPEGSEGGGAHGGGRTPDDPSGSDDPSDPGEAGPMPSTFLDVSGAWRTRYQLDVSAYLLGLPNLARQLDFLDQTFRGNINTGVPLLDAFIADVVLQYVPMWVVDLTRVLNTAATLFEVIEVNGGTLEIAQEPPATPDAIETRVHGRETWGELVLYVVDQCPGGRSNPNFPRCAELRVPVTHNPQAVGPVEILVELKPFEGVLSAGAPQADLRFDRREVDLEMRKFILLVLDTAVRVSTPYEGLRDALGAVVDCTALADRAFDFAYDSLGLSYLVSAGVSALVDNQCRRVLEGVANGFANIGVEWEAMHFDQLGRAVDVAANGPLRADSLQRWDQGSTIDGRFGLGPQAAMRGSWEGQP